MIINSTSKCILYHVVVRDTSLSTIPNHDPKVQKCLILGLYYVTIGDVGTINSEASHRFEHF